jgi:glycosyltransferase involved in cell wall biosynthesis
MRVLVLATDIFTHGGIARYTSTLASSLGKMLGPENVDVMCFFDWGYSGQLASEFGVIGMVSGDRRAGALSRMRFMFKAAQAGLRGYDLIIANHIALAPVAAMMKLVFGTPYWVSCHCVEVWWGTSRWRHAALKRADLILPVSGYTAEVVRNMDGVRSSRVKVVYNAIPNSFAELLFRQTPREEIRDCYSRFKPDSKRLLSVCSLAQKNEFKGVDTVIRALPRVLNAIPNLGYVVVGDGELRPKLEKLAIEVGVQGNVTFVGEITDAELAALYRGCDVFVLPSRGQERTGITGGEGFGRVYLEAAMAAKPVVGSRSGGASEAVLDARTGFVVNPDSSDQVAEALTAILQDPELAARMGSAGKAWACDRFSEDALSSSLRELLRPYGFRNEGVQELAHAGGRP